MIKFESFGKIPRLFREIVVTEKIDGTNAAIGIVFESFNANERPDFPDGVKVLDRGGFKVNGMVNLALVYAQSRKRIITPVSDNAGFAKWVYANADSLIDDLGPGLHFGEWWGNGIQRGYGLASGDKRFSLFNVKRWGNPVISTPRVPDMLFGTPGLDVVPVIERGEFSTVLVRGALSSLQWSGSLASPGFMNPEGVVVYHSAGNTLFKATIEGDEEPKSKFQNVASFSGDAVFRAAALIGENAA